jgi:hypothetical protein
MEPNNGSKPHLARSLGMIRVTARRGALLAAIVVQVVLVSDGTAAHLQYVAPILTNIAPGVPDGPPRPLDLGDLVDTGILHTLNRDKIIAPDIVATLPWRPLDRPLITFP